MAVDNYKSIFLLPRAQRVARILSERDYKYVAVILSEYLNMSFDDVLNKYNINIRYPIQEVTITGTESDLVKILDLASFRRLRVYSATGTEVVLNLTDIVNNLF